jgi:hypothetical protein
MGVRLSSGHVASGGVWSDDRWRTWIVASTTDQVPCGSAADVAPSLGCHGGPEPTTGLGTPRSGRW